MDSAVDLRTTIAVALAVVACGCAAGETTSAPSAGVPAYDLAPADELKADGYTFDFNDLISDQVFTDWAFMDEDAVQGFLEHTPYDTRSFLADYVEGDERVATRIVTSAKRHQINPLLLLVKLQVETSLIFKTSVPSRYTLDRATGCGCPDDRPGCYQIDAGLMPQINCTARLLRAYLRQIEADGVTITGWGVGKRMTSGDDVEVTPRTAGTAALYTYTPWVLRGQGGNWLLWNVYRKYALAVRRDRPNYRWIGGPCDGPSDCGYAGAVCLPSDARRGVGTCSLPCERVCPDPGTLFTATTFCVGPTTPEDASGLCVSQCDEALFPENDGCRTGQACVYAARAGEGVTAQWVCAPDGVVLSISTPSEMEPDDEQPPPHER